MARGDGFDDAASAMILAFGIVMLAICRDLCGVAAQRFAMMPGTDRFAILRHVALGAVAHWPLGDHARGVVPGRALDQLDVMRFLRGGLLRDVDCAAAEHCGARRRSHQLHHRRANRHSPVLSVPAGGVAQRGLPLPFQSPGRRRNADAAGPNNPVNRVSGGSTVPKLRKTGRLRNCVPKWNRMTANPDGQPVARRPGGSLAFVEQPGLAPGWRGES